MEKTIRVFGFPSNESAEVVKDFLERYTGENTVYALVIKQPFSGGPRAVTVVQFTTSRNAQTVITLVKQSLCYKGFFLKDCRPEHDIVQKPRTRILSVKQTTIRFGCQISHEKFYVLWKAVNVVADFESDPIKLNFFFSHHHAEYKLELSRNSIWQLQLRRPGSGGTKFLLIQVFGAPHIYEKYRSSAANISQNPKSSYFMDNADYEWVRATDFTPSCCIGQASAICLELPYNCGLPDFYKKFLDFKDCEGRFIMENGASFSHTLDLVPIVSPPEGVDLPFKILFKVCALVQNGCVPGPILDADFFRLVDPQRIPIASIEHALEKLYNIKYGCYEPVKWLNEHYMRHSTSPNHSQLPPVSLDSGLVYVHKVQITPTKVYFCGPEVSVSNRVLRNYPDDIDNFIRISFVDEDTNKLHSSNLSPRLSSANDKSYTRVYYRILSILKNGITIGDKKFDFLAYASSQLRENSAWMFCSRDGLTAADIREWMGDFHEIRNVPKYGARLGQSFSSSKETLVVDEHEVEIIPDVKVETGGVEYVFSDGIGKISAEFAEKVAIKCGFDGIPSAFQIRYGGYKGVVAVDPTSTMNLSLRDSMCKYQSKLKSLDVLARSKFQPCFLNRQVITLLSTLGVDDDVFERKQEAALDQLDTILTDPLGAQEALAIMSQGETTNLLKEMLKCGYKPDVEPFLSMMLKAFRASKLFEMKTKTRIFIPDARQLMGCLDETRTLEYGQVFVQVSNINPFRLQGASFLLILGRNKSNHQRFVVCGKVIVAKNPCLHPGDVRVLSAVDVPALHHMVDCVVFPQKGKRPHPNECSGSDLDGDFYFVSWDPELIPPRQVKPMDYTPPKPIILDHVVTIEEVEEYFVDYMVNDCLGIISNAHLAFADKEYNKAESNVCQELARLHSIAVDFAKTGVPARIPPHLQAKEFPDFMEKFDKPMYKSKRVIGKLFQEVKNLASQAMESFSSEVVERSYDFEMEVDGFKAYVDDAFHCKMEYDTKLWGIMDYFKIKTEAEVISGYMSNSFKKYMDVEAVDLAVKSLKKEVRAWFSEKRSESGSQAAGDEYAKASAWYHVTYHPMYWGCYYKQGNRNHFLSFPWCIYDKLIYIKRNKIGAKKWMPEVSSLEHQFSNGVKLI
ncbi:probable RNA-dependent RNA polymerase 1 [Malania oleifera]|uniref:probable RNA-dependent RNA polymerase 1 n=1 Tax=Malania oleifera TaxID=397392 RepID=UPI0025AE51FA|nr:probable RNA-dependent RNA polymerase 1 [Malania oleifera]